MTDVLLIIVVIEIVLVIELALLSAHDWSGNNRRTWLARLIWRWQRRRKT